MGRASQPAGRDIALNGYVRPARRQDKADRTGEILEFICEIGLAPTKACNLRRLAEQIIEGRDINAYALLS